jgi:hypothetical protein
VRFGRRIALAALVLCALGGSGVVIKSLLVPYEKDFRADYLAAAATLNGVNPYTPLPELAKAFLPGQSLADLPHPTPHPVAIGWLALPLTALSYERAAMVWFLLELGCLAVSVVLFLRILGIAPKPWHALAITFLLIGWWPVALELRWAQVSMFLLAMFLGAWLQLRRGKDISAGLLLGGLGFLKLAGWPIILWLIFMRRWRAVWAAVLFLAAGHLLAMQVYGWKVILDYYLKVGPQVTAFYSGWEVNFSAWTVGRRLFAQSGEVFQSIPLWNSPMLAAITTVAVPVLILITAVRAALRAKRLDTSFALLMAVGILLNPVTWQHYLIMAAPAFVLLVIRLRQLGWPRAMTVSTAALLMAVSVPYGIYRTLALRFAVGSTAAGKPIVHAMPALLTVTTGLALCSLLWLLVRLEKTPEYEPVTAAEPADARISPAHI